MAHSLIFREVAMVFAAALIFGMLAWRLRQPLILGYVLAGLVLSPFTPGLRVHEVHAFEIMAEIGVILLMFSVGIEFSIPELLKVKWVALVGAPLGIALSVALGAGVGALMGWPILQGVAVGCLICVASTMVMMRLLIDRGELSSSVGRIMITLTLVEDLAVIILTVLLPALAGASSSGYGQVAWKIGKALLLLVPIVLAGWKLVPALMNRVQRTCNDEISLMLALTVCLVVAVVTEAVGLSLALGAFLAGLLLGNSEFAHKLAKQTFSIRDAFVAVFFVTVGMLIDPTTWVSSWKIILLIVALVIVGKFVIWTGVVKLFGYSWDTALRSGIGLTQIGEFSFILAQVSLQSGLITPEIYHATLAASLITILANATFFKFLPPLATVPAHTELAAVRSDA
ncbi:MAG: cation:proton antiporter [Acidobacteria bacterium]|nr:cation:proton antiporter [Acidobacteriota bacterium]MBS1866171.1 cation:proton antiporter [Acidobacteriota bacterium]